MTDPIPYADYVRIEIHAEGKAEIIEFRPDDCRKVKAQLTRADMLTRDVVLGGLVRELPASDLRMTLEVSAPSATRITKDSDESPMPRLGR